MKANELMIGDWVQGNPCGQHCDRNNNTYYKIAVLDIGNHCWGYSVCGTIVELKYDNIFSIPLTREILEKNGFEDYDSYATLDTEKYRVIYAFDGFLTIVDDDNQRKVSYLECDYVHHLQHTLRLCRIEKEIEL